MPSERAAVVAASYGGAARITGRRRAHLAGGRCRRSDRRRGSSGAGDARPPIESRAGGSSIANGSGWRVSCRRLREASGHVRAVLVLRRRWPTRGHVRNAARARMPGRNFDMRGFEERRGEQMRLPNYKGELPSQLRPPRRLGGAFFDRTPTLGRFYIALHPGGCAEDKAKTSFAR